MNLELLHQFVSIKLSQNCIRNIAFALNLLISVFTLIVWQDYYTEFCKPQTAIWPKIHLVSNVRIFAVIGCTTRCFARVKCRRKVNWCIEMHLNSTHLRKFWRLSKIQNCCGNSLWTYVPLIFSMQIGHSWSSAFWPLQKFMFLRHFNDLLFLFI